jgi:hypothetical protein
LADWIVNSVFLVLFGGTSSVGGSYPLDWWLQPLYSVGGSLTYNV